MKTHLNWFMAIAVAGVLGLGLSVEAQETAMAPAKAATQVPVEQEVTTVTVFGRMPTRPTNTVRRLNRSSGSSCAFTPGSQDGIVDNYLDDVYGVRREGDDTNSLQTDGNGVVSQEPEGFRDSSPYGDASRETKPRIGVDAAGERSGCSQSDYNFAAGRNYILRKDTTLRDAFAAYNAGNFSKAVELFKQAYSKIGYDEAALMLGDLYLYGQGTKRDTKEAIAWYTKLAEARLDQSHYVRFNPKSPNRGSSRVQAQMKLARIYMTGFDVPKDPKEARHWYKAADDLDFIPARYVLGRMYQSGYGGEKNIKQAVKLYSDAAEYGYVPAQYALANLYFSGDEIAQDFTAAFEWYQQVAFNPYVTNKKPYAQFFLAKMYDQGQGVKGDPVRAFAFYKLAAVAGHPDAQNALATYFYTGQLVDKNLTITRKLFSAAATQGQPSAMVNLAAMLLKGEGGEKDVVKAYVWLKLAGKLGHTDAPAAAAKLEAKLTPEQKVQAEVILSPRPAAKPAVVQAK